MKKGDRVRDKFKVPRPSDECVTGTVMAQPTKNGNTLVLWDSPKGFVTAIHVSLLEIQEKEKPC